MVPLGDVAQVEACFGPFWTHLMVPLGLRRMYHRLGNHFGSHLMKLLGDVAHVESLSFSFGDKVSVGAR